MLKRKGKREYYFKRTEVLQFSNFLAEKYISYAEARAFISTVTSQNYILSDISNVHAIPRVSCAAK